MAIEGLTCANPECNCPAPSGGDYCSDYCQDPSLPDQYLYDEPLDTGAKLMCNCGHRECLEENTRAKRMKSTTAQ